jgi:Concanavalin A-like lectin/glucanases superfamily
MRIVWIVTALLVISTSAFAQPSGQYLRMQGYPQHGYIEIPNDALLDTRAMTVEAWVSVRDAHAPGCSSIAGMGFIAGWWLGLCGTTMRSYFNGSPHFIDGGVIPAVPTTVWIHIAAVTDGVTHKHYINGNLVSQGPEAPRSVATLPLRIGSDPNFDFMAEGGIDDLRIWKVARTQEQIRQTMSTGFILEANDVTGEFQGLEAWYRFEGNAFDSWRTHHGTIVGTGISFAPAPPFRRHSAGH